MSLASLRLAALIACASSAIPAPKRLEPEPPHLPERLFRYVDPWRVHAYAALGWNAIGECPSPHDGRPKAIMEWLNAGEPVEPLERTVVQITADEFVEGLVLEGDVVTGAAPIVAYMAKQRWTRRRVQDYCRRRGWSLQAIADNGAQAGRAEQAAARMARPLPLTHIIRRTQLRATRDGSPTATDSFWGRASDRCLILSFLHKSKSAAACRRDKSTQHRKH